MMFLPRGIQRAARRRSDLYETSWFQPLGFRFSGFRFQPSGFYNVMIIFEHVSKVFAGGVEAVSDLSLTVEEGETLVLLGTSGSGKTTTMKMVNRLIEPSGGRIFVDGRNILEEDPVALRRRIGYAIQHIGLFPHMTVAENIGVVPKLLGWRHEDIQERVDHLLGMTGLPPEDFRERFPRQLSGGQRQRIGVARCLAADPPIVLMDEPFGALDPITREQLQEEFLALESQIRKTIIFVTHDVFEAVKVGHRIALMDNGEMQQLATPGELVEKPANQFVDDFLGQHRFQLALLTRTVQSILPREGVHEEKESDTGEKIAAETGRNLSARASLIDALDLFKRTGLRQVSVYDGENYIGRLQKRDLTMAIGRVMEGTGS